ncbi:MAG: TIGR00725 family protein [Nitriliruptorales bacterium]|nr:TIGR00725 family protein [Nitriliruptorales bacterium]
MVDQVYIGVVGAGGPDADVDTARAVGREVAGAGAVLVCGGLGGVMEAAASGAQEAGGLTVGLLPGGDREAANPYLSVVIPTGLGELRNGLIVRASDALIAVGGRYGTLSEVAFALKTGVPVVSLDSWRPGDDVVTSGDPAEAVRLALDLARPDTA